MVMETAHSPFLIVHSPLLHYTTAMKQICLFLPLVLVFIACPQYDSPPEPELPVLYIGFVKAEYNNGNRSIYLEFQNTVSYDGIYPYYNMSELFDMALYLKGGPTIESTTYSKSGITIKLFSAQTAPLKLVFDTKNPWYFYNYKSWNYIMEAKAFIETPDLDVTGIP